MAGDDYLFANRHQPDQLRQPVLRFCGADFHIQNYSHKLWPYQVTTVGPLFT
jgi:hypothetical protein